jgi:hypothetical protein
VTVQGYYVWEFYVWSEIGMGWSIIKYMERKRGFGEGVKEIE